MKASQLISLLAHQIDMVGDLPVVLSNEHAEFTYASELFPSCIDDDLDRVYYAYDDSGEETEPQINCLVLSA